MPVGIAARHSSRLLFFIFLFFLVPFLVVLVGFFAFFFVVEIVGDEDEMNGVDLRYLELGLALGAIQDFAFFHFVFIHINLCGTLGTPYHGLSSFAEFAPRHAIGKKTRTPGSAYYIPPRVKSG